MSSSGTVRRFRSPTFELFKSNIRGTVLFENFFQEKRPLKTLDSSWTGHQLDTIIFHQIFYGKKNLNNNENTVF